MNTASLDKSVVGMDGDLIHLRQTIVPGLGHCSMTFASLVEQPCIQCAYIVR